MKKTMLFTALLILISGMLYAGTEDYGDNYQAGYEQGYTYSGGGIKPIAPIPPVPPMPRIGESSEDAFTRGVLDGHQTREERGN